MRTSRRGSVASHATTHEQQLTEHTALANTAADNKTQRKQRCRPTNGAGANNEKRRAERASSATTCRCEHGRDGAVRDRLRVATVCSIPPVSLFLCVILLL